MVVLAFFRIIFLDKEKVKGKVFVKNTLRLIKGHLGWNSIFPSPLLCDIGNLYFFGHSYLIAFF